MGSLDFGLGKSREKTSGAMAGLCMSARISSGMGELMGPMDVDNAQVLGQREMMSNQRVV